MTDTFFWFSYCIQGRSYTKLIKLSMCLIEEKIYNGCAEETDRKLCQYRGCGTDVWRKYYRNVQEIEIAMRIRKNHKTALNKVTSSKLNTMFARRNVCHPKNVWNNKGDGGGVDREATISHPISLALQRARSRSRSTSHTHPLQPLLEMSRKKVLVLALRITYECVADVG